MAKVQKTLEQRFWEKVEKTEYCWNWLGASSGGRYGLISDKANKKMYNTHRFSYMLHFGEIPEGKVICHRCDNTRCVNPDHLFVGTQLDNMRDMFSKGRRGVGEKHPVAILNNEQVAEVFSLRKSGLTFDEISDRFGVNRTTISAIFRGQSWNEIEGDRVSEESLIKWLNNQLEKNKDNRPGIYVGIFKKMWVKNIGGIDTIPEEIRCLYPRLFAELRAT